MSKLQIRPGARLALLVAVALLFSGCGLFRTKRKITVPQLLGNLASATTEQLIAEINRQAAVRSLNGRVDIQFLDTSFAACGLADLYRTADGRVIAQRPGQIYLSVLVPLAGTKIAEMSSDGQRFWAAVYQGDAKYRRFVTGTNTALYERLEENGGGADPDCRQDGERRERAMQRATVSALSSLRPQHLTDALLLPPIEDGGGRVYALAETFEEETDTRLNARRDARVVRGYYVLSELEPEGPGRARVLRRFWFDRVGAVRLARVQTYGERSQLTTDVVYSNPQPFGEGGRQRLPTQVELTRPQDRYSIRLTFQEPAAVEVDADKDADIFVLKNDSNLPLFDLDAARR
ncbi:MAG TPA: hypothetical protein VEY09_10570 [Pyrinomonadaceae bacterium]|nr:hypothetical protein [Pyrinomonadaceae bacterium]